MSEQLTLDQTTNIRSFTLQMNISFITLQQVSVLLTPYPGNDKWLGVLQKMNLSLSITNSDSLGTVTPEHPIVFMALMRNNFVQPVFNFNTDNNYPTAHDLNKNSFVKPFNKITFEMNYTPQPDFKVALNIIYDKTPGVTLI